MKGAPGSFFGGVPSALWLRQRRSTSKRNGRTLRGPQPCTGTRNWRWGAGRFDGFGDGGGEVGWFCGRGGGGWIVLREGGGRLLKKKKKLPHVSSTRIFVFEIFCFIFKVTNLFVFFLGVPFVLLLLLQQQKRGP